VEADGLTFIIDPEFTGPGEDNIIVEEEGRKGFLPTPRCRSANGRYSELAISRFDSKYFSGHTGAGLCS
jgi:hypothetical protein